MNLFQAAVLGVVQGATEFIPVSSSGHLVLVPWLFGWGTPGLTFTVASHLGTLIAVLIYFWRDWAGIAADALAWFRSREVTPNLRLLFLLIIGTIPAGVIGLLLQDQIGQAFETPLISAVMLSVTAALLFSADRIGQMTKTLDQSNWLDALIVGFGETVSIIPGISRSGATISAGLLRGLKREDAARYSFMLSVPIIAGAELLTAFDLLQQPPAQAELAGLAVGAVCAFVTGYAVIWWLLAYLRRQSMTLFGVYCVAASVFSIVVYFLRG